MKRRGNEQTRYWVCNTFTSSQDAPFSGHQEAPGQQRRCETSLTPVHGSPWRRDLSTSDQGRITSSHGPSAAGQPLPRPGPARRAPHTQDSALGAEGAPCTAEGMLLSCQERGLSELRRVPTRTNTENNSLPSVTELLRGSTHLAVTSADAGAGVRVRDSRSYVTAASPPLADNIPPETCPQKWGEGPSLRDRLAGPPPHFGLQRGALLPSS